MKSEYLIIEVKIEEFEKAVQCFSEKDVKFSIGAPIITVSLNKDIAYYIQILTAHHVYPISYFRKQESLIEQFHEYAGDDKNE